MDSVVGGNGAADVVNGGTGTDRFLVFDNDNLMGFAGGDVRINFRNSGSSTWSEGELEVIDSGLDLIQNRTQNTALLRDRLANQPIAFIKVNILPQMARLARNNLVTTVLGTETIIERQIVFEEFDETNPEVAMFHQLEITREISELWANDQAIELSVPSRNAQFSNFEFLSSWVEELPDNGADAFVRSGDNSQFYRESSVFVDDPLATVNSAEDWGSVWRLIFTPETAAEQQDVILKVDNVNEFFDLISS